MAPNSGRIGLTQEVVKATIQGGETPTADDRE
jgi:hypothetical protein